MPGDDVTKRVNIEILTKLKGEAALDKIEKRFARFSKKLFETGKLSPYQYRAMKAATAKMETANIPTTKKIKAQFDASKIGAYDYQKSRLSSKTGSAFSKEIKLNKELLKSSEDAGKRASESFDERSKYVAYGTNGYEGMAKSQTYMDKGTKELNKKIKEQGKSLKDTGKEGKKFKMEYLGIMFAGMQVSRMFGDMTKGAMDWLGIGELFQTSLNLIALEGLLPMADGFYTFIDNLQKIDPEAKKAIGGLMFFGQAGGIILQTFGALVLAMSSLMMVSKGFAGPVVTAFGAIIDTFAPMIGAIPGFEGLSGAFKLLGKAMVGGGIVWTGITILESLEKVAGAWDKLSGRKTIGIDLDDKASGGIATLLARNFGKLSLGDVLKGGVITFAIIATFEVLQKTMETAQNVLDTEKAITDSTKEGSDAIAQGGYDRQQYIKDNTKIAETLHRLPGETGNFITGVVSSGFAVNAFGTMLDENGNELDLFAGKVSNTTQKIDAMTSSVKVLQSTSSMLSPSQLGTRMETYEEAKRLVSNLTMSNLSSDTRAYIEGIAKKYDIPFQYGGVVPGRFGEPVPIIAHGGERFEGIHGEYGGGSTINFSPSYNITVSDSREFEAMIKANNDNVIRELKAMVI